MIATQPNTAAYLARRGVSHQWRAFLRAMVETLDEHLDAEARNVLLRAIGARIAGATPLLHCSTLEELEARMNDALAAMDWGFVELSVDPAERALMLTHGAAPVVSAGDDAGGRWIGAVLEGLYAIWLAEQPGADRMMAPKMVSAAPGEIRLRYGAA